MDGDGTLWMWVCGFGDTTGFGCDFGDVGVVRLVLGSGGRWGGFGKDALERTRERGREGERVNPVV